MQAAATLDPAGGLGRPAPLPCLFNSLLREEDVQWSERPDGRAHQLSVKGCALHRFTHLEARQCLAGKRLLFLGDSVTR